VSLNGVKPDTFGWLEAEPQWIWVKLAYVNEKRQLEAYANDQRLQAVLYYFERLY
jgi:hypothetical protein